MRCSHCGSESIGSFCPDCGEAMPVSSSDWLSETRYEVLVRHRVVRGRIAAASSRSKRHMTGEEFLKRTEDLLALATGAPGVPVMSMTAKVVVPLFAKLGVRTKNLRNERIERPIGEVLVAVICSLARQGSEIKQVHQAVDGCVLEATIPSDFRSWDGSIIVSTSGDESASRVEAATAIRGQMYDWGKSKKYLNQLFLDVRATGE
jgi:hypothetical protein